jgi:signal transduction histidine kinase
VDAVISELRRIAHGTFPPVLRNHGLVAALRAESAHAAIAVEIGGGEVGRSTPEVELALYLCCLEAIQNAAKHAGDGATVTVELTPGDGELAFSVRDTGKGFDPRTTAPGAGLRSIRERVAAVGGRLEVASQPRHGTTVSGAVPWRRRQPPQSL